MGAKGKLGVSCRGFTPLSKSFFRVAQRINGLSKSSPALVFSCSDGERIPATAPGQDVVLLGYKSRGEVRQREPAGPVPSGPPERAPLDYVCIQGQNRLTFGRFGAILSLLGTKKNTAKAWRF